MSGTWKRKQDQQVLRQARREIDKVRTAIDEAVTYFRILGCDNTGQKLRDLRDRLDCIMQESHDELGDLGI